jgi:hypothetical protein
LHGITLLVASDTQNYTSFLIAWMGMYLKTGAGSLGILLVKGMRRAQIKTKVGELIITVRTPVFGRYRPRRYQCLECEGHPTTTQRLDWP